MIDTISPSTVRLHPLHAILLAFPLPLFLGALLSDLAYQASFNVQWANFSSWLIAGGLFFGGFALLWALVALFVGETARTRQPARLFCRSARHVGDRFHQRAGAREGCWATMPEGLYLSVITALLALVAAWIGYSGFRAGEVT